MEQILIQKAKRKDSEVLRNILKRNNIPFNNCRFCNDFLERIEIHHTDGNFLNNDVRNLVVLCSYCHWAIHFKPNQLMKRNIGNQWNKGREFTDEHKKNMSLCKKDKTYLEIYGDNGIIKAENHSKIMKHKVKNYERNEKGIFVKKPKII